MAAVRYFNQLLPAGDRARRLRTQPNEKQRLGAGLRWLAHGNNRPRFLWPSLPLILSIISRIYQTRSPPVLLVCQHALLPCSSPDSDQTQDMVESVYNVLLYSIPRRLRSHGSPPLSTLPFLTPACLSKSPLPQSYRQPCNNSHLGDQSSQFVSHDPFEPSTYVSDLTRFPRLSPSISIHLCSARRSFSYPSQPTPSSSSASIFSPSTASSSGHLGASSPGRRVCSGLHLGSLQ